MWGWLKKIGKTPFLLHLNNFCYYLWCSELFSLFFYEDSPFFVDSPDDERSVLIIYAKLRPLGPSVNHGVILFGPLESHHVYFSWSIFTTNLKYEHHIFLCAPWITVWVDSMWTFFWRSARNFVTEFAPWISVWQGFRCRMMWVFYLISDGLAWL